jgi:hypothetical protein
MLCKGKSFFARTTLQIHLTRIKIDGKQVPPAKNALNFSEELEALK